MKPSLEPAKLPDKNLVQGQAQVHVGSRLVDEAHDCRQPQPAACSQLNRSRCLECGVSPPVSAFHASVWQSRGDRHTFPSIPLSRHFQALVVMTQLFTAGLTKKIPAARDLSGRQGQAPYLAPIFLDPSFFDSPSPPPLVASQLPSSNSAKRAFQNTSAPCSCSGTVSSAPLVFRTPHPSLLACQSPLAIASCKVACSSVTSFIPQTTAPPNWAGLLVPPLSVGACRN